MKRRNNWLAEQIRIAKKNLKEWPKYLRPSAEPKALPRCVCGERQFDFPDTTRIQTATSVHYLDQPCHRVEVTPEKASCLHVAGSKCICVKCGETVNFGVMPSLNGSETTK